MGGKRRDYEARAAALRAALAETAPAGSAADFWSAVTAAANARLGYRLSVAAVQMAAARLGLARPRAPGFASLRISAEAAACPYCQAAFTLRGTVAAADLVAFAVEHNICRRRYNRERAQ